MEIIKKYKISAPLLKKFKADEAFAGVISAKGEVNEKKLIAYLKKRPVGGRGRKPAYVALIAA